MLEVSCPRCRDSHAVEVSWTKDKNGRDRIVYMCPVKGSRVSSYPPRGASVTRTEGAKMARTTTKTGSTPQSLRVSIPMVVDSDPDIAAAWDIAEGILDGLAALSGGGSNIQREAAAAFARAKGDSSTADTTEHAFGKALAEALRLVAVHRGMSSAEWAALAPTSLGAGSSVPGLPGVVLQGAGSLDLGAIGSAGGAAVAGAIGLPPSIGAGLGGIAGDQLSEFLLP